MPHGNSKRLALQISPADYRRIEQAARARGQTVAAYSRRAILDAVRQDDLHLAIEAVEYGKLEPADLIRLDAACREAGVDLVAGLK
jgi:predicted DNA-binding protein